MRRISLSIIVALLCSGLTGVLALADEGRQANATISFGEWRTNPPLDRFPIDSPRERNEHQLIPNEVKIKAGGSVNFIIGGFHQPIVYDVGTEPGDIKATLTTPSTGTPANVPLINDPNHRIYRGLDPSRLHLVDPKPAANQPPSTVLQDRVEVVHFSKPGTYLVICGVQPHFVNDHMFGFVTVLPKGKGDKDDDDR